MTTLQNDNRSEKTVRGVLETCASWLEDDAVIAALVDRLPEINRETSCGGRLSRIWLSAA
jgi:hypothetical protein